MPFTAEGWDSDKTPGRAPTPHLWLLHPACYPAAAPPVCIQVISPRGQALPRDAWECRPLAPLRHSSTFKETWAARGFSFVPPAFTQRLPPLFHLAEHSGRMVPLPFVSLASLSSSPSNLLPFLYPVPSSPPSRDPLPLPSPLPSPFLPPFLPISVSSAGCRAA